MRAMAIRASPLMEMDVRIFSLATHAPRELLLSPMVLLLATVAGCALPRAKLDA